MNHIILRTNKLCKSFSIGGVQQHVLKNLDLEIKEGDFTVIMGSSGSGKSTLLYALSGMDVPTVGDVYCTLNKEERCIYYTYYFHIIGNHIAEYWHNAYEQNGKHL